MDSRIGLDYIVENRDYIAKLGTALDTQNETVKKQVFELLAALCSHSSDGYARAIETLDFYKNLKEQRYRFKIVINELEQTCAAESPPHKYQATLLSFINCVIIAQPNLQERIRIRNELIGLKLMPLLNNLRKVAQSVNDIILQLDVFVEHQECDEEAPEGINLNSHLDVFYAILRQVADKPQEAPFLSILQHLLRIDPKDPLIDVIWDTTERLVHRATLLESTDDAHRLQRQQSTQKFTCPSCRANDACSPTRKPTQKPPAAPPPPPAPAPPPPPPPAVFMANGVKPTVTVNGAQPPPPPPPVPNGSPLPPPPAPPSLARPRSPQPEVLDQLLPQQNTPAPSMKMKTINWGKIPHNKVLDNENLWHMLATMHRDSSHKGIDFMEMETLFCQQTSSTQGSPKLGKKSGTGGNRDTMDSKPKNPEITLLDGKRSLNVNIFLKQFRSSNEHIIQRIQQGEHKEIGAERLRGLLKILPEVDELDMLKSFNGDKTRLGNAEKFLLQLLEVPKYKLRIESMLLKEEFAANVASLESCINAVLYASDDLLSNKPLQEVLYMVIVAGNFLNSGGYAGNAAGVKLASLQKLTDIRANKPGMNLLHFVALQAERRNPELLKFPTQFSTLENASKTTAEQINNEISTLDTRIRKISRQIEQPTTDADIKEQMTEFLQAAESELRVLQAAMKQVAAMRLKLAEFFCEDAGTFKLEECFKIFHQFCDKFRQAIKENERRQLQEQKAQLAMKQREEQNAKKAKQMGQAGTPVSDCDSFMGDGMFDPRASPALVRRHLGSGEIINSFIRLEQDSASPDITPNGSLRRPRQRPPNQENDLMELLNNSHGGYEGFTPNGSLRRRRSRVLANEDDLMDVLRSSTGPQDHISRERKAAYGSLDRSWARRARSGSSSRKRPDLLNIDFGLDRERASSPAPLLQQQVSLERLQSPLASSGTATPTTAAHTPNSNGPTSLPNQAPSSAAEDTKPRISREWRQKIETWLQSNENDEKQNEEYKRKRRLVNANRRSLENEAENERKLDPLPEEKIMTTTTTTPTNTPTMATNPINQSARDQEQLGKYQRVYADWRPSKALEQTDVLGNMQAIAEATGTQPHLTTAEELRQYRRQRSQEQSQTPCALQSIAEEDRRKSIIQKLGEADSSHDRLKVYVRRTSSMDMQPESVMKLDTTPPSKSSTQDDTFANLLDHHKSHNESKELDADNIETPPVTRRIIATPNTTVVTVSLTDKPKHAQEEQKTKTHPVAGEQDAPGTFDRHALARRTRRYKRPTDYSSGNEEPATASHDIKQSASASELRRQHQKEEKQPAAAEKTRTITKLEKVGRHISSINQEDVREAIRNLKSPTGTPERPWSPPRELTPSKLKLTSSGHPELNDEGFEETQSLVSDTPSHGKGESTNSSCNEANDTPTQRSRPLSKQKTSTTSISRLSDRLQQSRLRSSSTAPKAQSTAQLPAQPKRSLSASRPLRMPNGSPMPSSTPTSHIRSAASAGVRRLPQDYTISMPKSHDVERSNSRNSLRSSKSSINSGASTQTVVRRLPAVQRTASAHATVSVDSSPSKRPLAAQNTRLTTGRGVPASRSSSSGSSVGPSVIVVRSKLTATPRSTAPATTIGNSTSFKENQSTAASRLTAARSAMLVKNVINQQQQQQQQPQVTVNRSNSSSSPQQRSNRSVSSFMRPTASSSTKRQK